MSRRLAQYSSNIRWMVSGSDVLVSKRKQDRSFLRAQVVSGHHSCCADEPFGNAQTSPFFGRPSFIRLGSSLLQRFEQPVR
jgi:hypothetical protein